MSKSILGLFVTSIGFGLCFSGPVYSDGFLVETAGRSAETDRLAEEARAAEDGIVFIGDMAFRRETLLERGFGGRTWPGGLLPIGFTQNVSARNRERFFRACAEWSKVAAVRCVPHTGERDWIEVHSGPGNWSELGRTGGKQQLEMFNWEQRFIIAHEIGHALGLGHEQQRPDRNSFVELIPEAVNSNALGNFRIMPMRTHTGYDFGSVMHYGPTAFGKPDPRTGLAQTTLRPRPDFDEFARFMGQRQKLSTGDAAGMAAQYGAPLRALPGPAELGLAVDDGEAVLRALSGQRSTTFEDGTSPLVTLESYPPYREAIRAMTAGGIDKVFGGVPVEPPRFADVVGIAEAGSSVVSCTGTLVAPDRVVTARHCACDGISGRVMVGASADDSGVVWHDVAGGPETVGEICGPIGSANNPDLAVLHLATPVKGVTPRAFATAAEIDGARIFTVAGFGYTELFVLGRKHETEVPSATNDCSREIPAWGMTEAQAFGCISGQEIVAGQTGLGRDTCNGDSGGPLFVLPEGTSGEASLKLAGVTSRATATASANGPVVCGDGGIYVRLTDDNRAFIQASTVP